MNHRWILCLCKNNEELKDQFDEFIEIPTLVSDNESEEIESIATKTSAPHWKPQLSLQPTSATSQSSSNREGVQAARFNVQSANNHQHQPVVHQHTSTQRANIKRGILATRKITNNQLLLLTMLNNLSTLQLLLLLQQQQPRLPNNLHWNVLRNNSNLKEPKS